MAPKTATRPASSTATRIDVYNLDRTAEGDQLILKRGGVEETHTITKVQQFKGLRGVRITLDTGDTHSLDWGKTINLVRSPGKPAFVDRDRPTSRVSTLDPETVADMTLPLSARIETAIKLTARQLTDAHLRSAIEFPAGDVVTYGRLDAIDGKFAGYISLTVEGQAFSVHLNKVITVLPIDNRVHNMIPEDL